MSKDTDVRCLKDIMSDYVYNPDIMSDQDERAMAVLKIINTRLSRKDRSLIVLYIEYRSYRKLGRRLGCSHTKVMLDIHRICSFIKDEYYKMHKL